MPKTKTTNKQACVQVRTQMEAYRLYAVVPYLVGFIEQLTNIYVRYNRKRLKGGRGPEDSEMALATLFDTLLKVRARNLTSRLRDANF